MASGLHPTTDGGSGIGGQAAFGWRHGHRRLGTDQVVLTLFPDQWWPSFLWLLQRPFLCHGLFDAGAFLCYRVAAASMNMHLI